MTTETEWWWEDRIRCRGIVACRRDRLCRQCLTSLEGTRRTATCSDACTITFDRNHFWRPARTFALRTARHPDGGYRCARCSGQTHRPEVNHRDPLRGGPRFATCKNHQSNLEVLCHDCHLIETARQNAEARVVLVANHMIPE